MVAGLEYVVAGTDSLKDEAGNRLVAGPTTAPDYPRNAQRFVFSGDAGVDSKPPRVSSAASQSNTTVLVQFSKPMHVNATEASAYVIVQANVNPEAGALLVDTAEFVGSDFSRVRLTTKSQNELLYEVTVVNVTDRAGVPLAAKEIVAGAVIDPSTATFPGTPPNAGADEDMDGLADNLEQRGWVVTVTLLDGSTEQRQVTSNPDLGDTDGDGLSDYEEAQLRTYPRDRDTDNDLLDDGFEWNELYSNPVAQDTDGDGLLDAYEVQSTKTSPLVDDTDGDGLTDGDELFAFNRDPLIADIPAVVIEVGDVRLQIEETFTYTDEQGNSVSESNTTNTALTRGSNSSFLVDWHERHDNTTKFVSGGITLGIDGSGVDEKSCPSVGVCVGGITVLGHVEGGQQWDEGDTWMDGGEAATESARAFEETAEEVRERTSSNSVTREVIGARMDVDVTIKNSGDLAFTVRDLQVTVLQRNPLDTRGLIPVATLVSNRELVTGEPLAVNLGPFNRERGPLLFTSRDVFPALVQELMRQPRGLVFKIANYNLTDEFGRSFEFANQTTRDRTVQILIDNGDMGANRYLVSTSAVMDDAHLAGGGLVGGFDDRGRATGLPLDYVLQGILGLKKFRPAVIVAGANGVADTTVEPNSDDVQRIPPGTTGLDPLSVVIDPGANGTIESAVACDVEEPRGMDRVVVAGVDGVADSTVKPNSDDVQLIPPGTTGLDPADVVIDAGANGTIESSVACDEEEHSEPDGIIAGLNKTADSYAEGDDIQHIPPGTTGLSLGSIVVGAGANGVIDSTPGKDDQLEFVTGYETSRTCDQLSENAFEPCRQDIECEPSGQGGGFCAPPERLVRVGSLRNGDFNRSWFVLGTGDLPTAANFGDLRARAREDLKLAFLQDLDRDGLFAQEEFISGSLDSGVDRFRNSTFGVDFDLDAALQNPMPDQIPDSQDTDFDGLGDFAEVKVGWRVSTEAGLMQVFSSPRSRDTDGEGLLDPEERNLSGYCDLMNDPRRDGVCAFQNDPVDQIEADGIVAGRDGVADTTATGDDEQLVPVGTARLPYDTAIVGPGTNKVIDTVINQPTVDDEYTSLRSVPPASDPSRRDTDDDAVTDFEELEGFEVGLAFVDGGNGYAETLAQGDDVQRALFQQPVLPGGVVVLPGLNQELDSTPEPPSGDDVVIAIQLPSMLFRFQIGCGPNGILETIANTQRCAASGCIPQNTASFSELLYARCADPQRGIVLTIVSNSNTPPGGFVRANNVNDDMLQLAHTVMTDPLRRDTDSDTIADGTERAEGSDPTEPDGTDFRDADQDGLFDAEETDLGWDVSVDNANPVRVKSSPGAADSDEDGLPDLIERYLRTDPNRADTDGDGITDFDEVADFPTYVRLSAPYPGIVINGSDSASYGTNPRRRDTDGDGLTDLDEVTGYGFINAERVRTVVITDPLRGDTDSDGRSDAEERNRNDTSGQPAPTDATNPDTDGDGKLDGADSDPLVPNHRVRVRFTRLQANKLIEDSTTGNDLHAALGWWFLVTDPDGVTHRATTTNVNFTSVPGLHVEPMVTSSPPPSPTPTPSPAIICSAAVYPNGNAGNGRLVPRVLRLDFFGPGQGVDRVVEFELHPGESFAVHGLWADFFSQATCSAGTNAGAACDEDSDCGAGSLGCGDVPDVGLDRDCGKSPLFAPRAFRSSCYNNFNYAYDYDDIAGSSEAVIRVDSTDKTSTRRNDGCDVEMHFEIIID